MRACSVWSLLLLLVLVCPVLFFVATPTGPQAPSRNYVGQVLDHDQPVSGAVVRFKGSPHSVRSDRQGRFQLPSPLRGPNRITASKEGYFVAGARADGDPLRLLLHRLPTQDNPDYAWVDPSPDPRGEHNCANCHQEIHREWADSGHAHSATGRRFRDLYTGAGGGWGLLTQHPDGAGVCAACHAPALQPGDPALFRLDQVRGVASRGVHCDYCHKITGLTGDELGLAHGRDVLTLLRPKEGQLFLGPLDDVDRGEDVYSPFYRDSRYCAACHEGVVFGVHVYSTYREWLESPARSQGQQCQDCHMKPTGRLSNIAPGRGGISRDPLTLANHRFFDGSREEMLRRSLRARVDFVARSEGVQVRVRIRAEGVGHRVPTGFIDRHLLLTVEGRDRQGRELRARQGPSLPALAGPQLAGRPGRLFARLLRDEQNRSPAPFWKALPEPEDTRLLPGREEFLDLDFGPELGSIRLRLIHRRFWAEVEQAKGWPASDIVVIDRIWARPH